MNRNGILIDLSDSDRTNFGKVDFRDQSTPQKVFSSIWAVESEVNNGGFSQYFGNRSCETAAFVAEALDKVGAPRTADICRRAVATAFPSGLPRIRTRSARLLRISLRTFRSGWTSWIGNSTRIPIT
jgi:hypothetical protein